ncbi:class I lanthipeptide [Chitinophaga nivalis]|uniref:class I lanthipeptide n=1 Tax=Chitinophaga nivalis TaxID=2991709 RepID=UPI00353131A7
MKKKNNTDKKLSLKRETIVQLTSNDMTKIHGGDGTGIDTSCTLPPQKTRPTPPRVPGSSCDFTF